MMQGALVSDEQAPPQQLRRHLEAELKCEVSVLNTGHLGYSTEQYFHTLREFGRKFLLVTDFGEGTGCPRELDGRLY